MSPEVSLAFITVTASFLAAIWRGGSLAAKLTAQIEEVEKSYNDLHALVKQMQATMESDRRSTAELHSEIRVVKAIVERIEKRMDK